MKTIILDSTYFGVLISLGSYWIGTQLKKKWNIALLNPLLIAIILTMTFLVLFHIDYDTYNQSGQYISYLLTPATVCLAVPLYQQMELLKKNLKAVIIGIVSGCVKSPVPISEIPFFLAQKSKFSGVPSLLVAMENLE